ncbi:MAG: hypothetical protein Q4F83_08805 [Eubacteriales bacterium]|nr:hypothetical protein [Eubacteriales bacterium]
MKNNMFWRRTVQFGAIVTVSVNMISVRTMAAWDRMLIPAETEGITEAAENVSEEITAGTGEEHIHEQLTEQITEQITDESGPETETETEETENWLDEMDDWMAAREESEWVEEYYYEDTEQAELESIFQEDETSDTRSETEAMADLRMADIENYLTVRFEQNVSFLECFPEDYGIEKVVQNGFTMINLSPKSLLDKGRVGARYRKIAKQGEKWYDLRMTLEEFEKSEIISKEGMVDIFPGIAFCTEQIGWGIRGQAGKIVLKMEFVENDTDRAAAINTRFRWRDIDENNRPQISLGDGYFGAHYYLVEEQKDHGDMVYLLNECSTWYMTLENREDMMFKVICLEDIEDSGEEDEAAVGEKVQKGVNTIRQDPEVRLFVTQRNRQTGQWVTNTVFEVYEWNGYEYAIYRGSLVYDQSENFYTMDNLVRNDINEGKYKIVEMAGTDGEADGWEQEILVPDMPVITDLYYRVEE